MCVVSFWSEWNSCVGNCQFALRVRNRNVIRPPFPERTPDGRLAIRPCPSLYQVQTCIPPPCLSTNKNETLVNSVNAESTDANVVSVEKVAQEASERARIEKLPHSVEAKFVTAEVPPVSSTTTTPIASTTPSKVPIGDGVAAFNEVNQDEQVNEDDEAEDPFLELPDTNQDETSTLGVVSSTQPPEIELNSTTVRSIELSTETPLKAPVSVGVADVKSAKSEEVKDSQEIEDIEEAVAKANASQVVATSDKAETVVEAVENSNATSADDQTEAATQPTSTSKPELSTTQRAIIEDNLAASTIASTVESPAAIETDDDDEPRRAPTIKPYRRNTKPCESFFRSSFMFG